MRSLASPRSAVRLFAQRKDAETRSAQQKEARAQMDRVEAQQLREHAEDQVRDAVPAAEYGLSRRGLFERLRVLAVGRAHAIESMLQAEKLESKVAQSLAQAQQHRMAVRDLERKQGKLRAWIDRKNLHKRRRALALGDDEIQEEYVCRTSTR